MYPIVNNTVKVPYYTLLTDKRYASIQIEKRGRKYVYLNLESYEKFLETLPKLTYKQGNHFIQSRTIGDNNGLRNQVIPVIHNANIETVSFNGNVIIANGQTKYKTKNLSFWLTHLYKGSDNKIHCAGYYNKDKNPYSDDSLLSHRFSVNICTIGDLVF